MSENDHVIVGMTMHMSVKWTTNISFIFESWTALEGETGLLIIGFILTVVASALSVMLPSIKTKITQSLFKTSQLMQENENDLIESDDQPAPLTRIERVFMYSLMHIATMMLIMTYNGYVIIMVIVGLIIGYTFFGMECDKDKNIPVNCCA